MARSEKSIEQKREYQRLRRATMTPEQKEEQRLKNAAWRAKNPDYGRNWYRANREHQLTNTRKWQRVYSGVEGAHGELPSGPCEICGKRAEKLRFDHCHGTGQFRGWLCHKCNVGLHYVENPAWLEAARGYLARTSKA